MRFVLLLIAIAGCRPPGYGKEGEDASPDGMVRPDAGQEIDGAIDDADAAPITCDKTFRVEGHETATSVWVSGDFVGWAGTPEDGAIALSRGGDGAWSGTRTFDAGVYQYKLVLDGSTWIVDPANPDTIEDGLGGQNSVYRCP